MAPRRPAAKIVPNYEATTLNNKVRRPGHLEAIATCRDRRHEQLAAADLVILRSRLLRHYDSAEQSGNRLK